MIFLKVQMYIATCSDLALYLSSLPGYILDSCEKIIIIPSPGGSGAGGLHWAQTTVF